MHPLLHNQAILPQPLELSTECKWCYLSLQITHNSDYDDRGLSHTPPPPQSSNSSPPASGGFDGVYVLSKSLRSASYKKTITTQRPNPCTPSSTIKPFSPSLWSFRRSVSGVIWSADYSQQWLWWQRPIPHTPSSAIKQVFTPSLRRFRRSVRVI
jgi:hypothetical protein